MSILLSLFSIWLVIAPTEYVATGYAPLDPKAVRGVCYSGNPKITASGVLTTPGVSVATSKEIPFGTWLWITGVGFRRVDDRGGKIKGNKIDICFHTKKEALEWGKKKVRVIIITKIVSQNASNFLKKLLSLQKQQYNGKANKYVPIADSLARITENVCCRRLGFI